jgi:hypothetical protein
MHATGPAPHLQGISVCQCVQSVSEDQFKPMRGLRVGYMRQCVFFVDDDGDGKPSFGAGERSQPSGPRGEVALFVPGESDTLSAKHNSSLLMRAPRGAPLRQHNALLLVHAPRRRHHSSCGPCAPSYLCSCALLLRRVAPVAASAHAVHRRACRAADNGLDDFGVLHCPLPAA